MYGAAYFFIINQGEKGEAPQPYFAQMLLKT
jgi:hypothetical protein